MSGQTQEQLHNSIERLDSNLKKTNPSHYMEEECEDSTIDIEVETYDSVYHVNHYQFIGDLEVRHIIQKAIKLNGLTGCQGHYYGNVLKYLLRCGRKGTMKKDLAKAKEYLRYLDEITKEDLYEGKL